MENNIIIFLIIIKAIKTILAFMVAYIIVDEFIIRWGRKNGKD